MRIWARTVMMLAAALLAAALFRAEPAGLDLAADQSGVSFKFRSAFISIAFDIGQTCSKSDACGRMLG